MGDEKAGTTVAARMWGDSLEQSHTVATSPCYWHCSTAHAEQNTCVRNTYSKITWRIRRLSVL